MMKTVAELYAEQKEHERKQKEQVVWMMDSVDNSDKLHPVRFTDEDFLSYAAARELVRWMRRRGVTDPNLDIRYVELHFTNESLLFVMDLVERLADSGALEK
jgi:hypothetical protein